MRLALCFLLCASAALNVAAQAGRSELKKQIDEYRRAGRAAETEPLLEQLLELETKESGADSEELVPILDHLARVALSTNRHDRAQTLYRQALAILQNKHGRSSQALIPMLQALVRAQQIAQRHSDAVATQLRLISIRVNSVTPDANADLGGDYLVLGRLYAAQSNFSQAVAFYNWSLELLEKQFGLDDGRLLPVLDALAVALREDHKFENAAAVLLRAVSIREAVVGPFHPDLAQSLDNLGAVYYAMKRFADAEPVYERSLKIWIQHLGPSHPMVATSLDNLGVTCASQNKFEKAEKIYRQALDIRDAEEASSLRNLALVLTGRGKYAESEPYFKRALALLTAPSKDLLATLLDYADALDHLHRRSEAARLRVRATRMEAELAASQTGSPKSTAR